ncbi:MAG TPA: methanol dehydrogenase [Treponema sp.]|nr:methanol dehydrogenase [Treponema sp.]
MIHRSRKFLFAVFILVCLPLVSSFSLEVPQMRGAVTDVAAVMTTQEHNQLEAFLNAVNTQTGVQIAVLTIPSLEGESLEDFALKAAETFALGEKGLDNGALLFVAVNERAIRIEVGYGLEESLTDAKSGLIIRNVIAPQFRSGKYGTGLIEGARNMAGIATGNAEIVSEAVKNDQGREQPSKLPGLFFLLVFFILLSGGRGRRGGLLGALFLGNMLGSGRNGSSGRSSGGGFGGFSGGGGGFGGGGASGGW